MPETAACQAPGCKEIVESSFFMCPPHWELLSADVRRRVCRHYKDGVFVRGPGWEDLLEEARRFVSQKEFESCVQNHGANCGCWRRRDVEAVSGKSAGESA